MHPSVGVMDDTSRALSRSLKEAATNLNVLRNHWNHRNQTRELGKDASIYDHLENISSRISEIQLELSGIRSILDAAVVPDAPGVPDLPEKVMMNAREYLILQKVFYLYMQGINGENATIGPKIKSQ